MFVLCRNVLSIHKAIQSRFLDICPVAQKVNCRGMWVKTFLNCTLTDLSNIDGQQQWCVSNYQMPILTIISGVKTTDVTDAANPLIHLLFCVSYQVEDAVNGLDVEYEAVLQVLLVERQPSVHLKGQQACLNLIWYQLKNKWLNIYN